MTLAEIEKLTSETLTCKQVAAVLGCGETYLHTQIIEDQSKVQFPTIVYGTRVKIPRMAFIKYMRGEMNVNPG